MDNTFALSTPRRYQGGIHGDDAKERLKRFIQSFPADTVREIKTIYFYSSEIRERSAGNIRSRAGEASRVEFAAYGHGQEPPVVWSAVEETRPGQVWVRGSFVSWRYAEEGQDFNEREGEARGMEPGSWTRVRKLESISAARAARSISAGCTWFRRACFLMNAFHIVRDMATAMIQY